MLLNLVQKMFNENVRGHKTKLTILGKCLIYFYLTNARNT